MIIKGPTPFIHSNSITQNNDIIFYHHNVRLILTGLILICNSFIRQVQKKNLKNLKPNIFAKYHMD